MSAALLPLATVKTLLGISDTASDAKLTAALPVVTEYFENYCKRGLAFVADVVEEFRGSARLMLFRYPVAVVDEFSLDDVIAAIPPVDKAHGVIYVRGCNPACVARVTYDGGYAEADVPADLADAYARCCADYAGVAYTVGGSVSGSGGGAPLKSLGLGSGALTVRFDTAVEARSSYDTSSVPPVLAPYLFVLEHYRMKDSV